MTTKKTKAKAAPKHAANGADAGPKFAMLAQYVKDLSFENPKIVQNLTNPQEQPHIDIDVQVHANRLNDEHFEVELLINGKATAAGKKETEFLIELAYAGIFLVAKDVPQEDAKILLLIEAPRFLFPFARQIVSNLTQSGGLPPLLLQPIDFAALYVHQQEQGGKGTKH
jgi:preprotein translocase subunit SecB